MNTENRVYYTDDIPDVEPAPLLPHEQKSIFNAHLLSNPYFFSCKMKSKSKRVIHKLIPLKVPSLERLPSASKSPTTDKALTSTPLLTLLKLLLRSALILHSCFHFDVSLMIQDDDGVLILSMYVESGYRVSRVRQRRHKVNGLQTAQTWSLEDDDC